MTTLPFTRNARTARGPRTLAGALVWILATGLLLAALAPSPALALGARPRAMGSAFIAVSDDENAVFTNPAGLSQIDKSMVQAGANVAFRDDYKTDHFIYAGKIYQSTGKEKLTLEDYLEADYELKTKPEKVANYSWGLGLLREERSLKLNKERGFVPPTEDHIFTGTAAFATRFPIAERLTRRPELYGGMAVRFVDLTREIPSLRVKSRADTWDLDFSLLYKANPRLNVGLVLGNVISTKDGSTLGARTDSFVTNVGGAYTLGAKRETIFAVDVMNVWNARRAIDQRLRIGAERQFLENDFALRIGSDGGVLTLGFGIQFFKDFKLDYSYFNGTLVKEHFVSVRLPF
ncbi:MAG: hypothetical protein HY814_04190 [Candidatus Riflebacteria bacterium]|nr:hypothetical protein [Candidatus Riflebacteria bacterium]